MSGDRRSIVPSASFAPLSKSGIVAGLEKDQLIVLAVAILPVLMQVMLFRNLGMAVQALLFWGIPVGILAVGSWKGRSLLSRLMIEGLYWFRVLGRQTTAVPPLRVKSERGRLNIPGALGERISLHELPIVDMEFMDGDQAFVFDKNPKNPTATAVIAVKTEGWLLADDAVKAARVDAVNELCRTMATHSGVARITNIARSYRASVEAMPVPARIYEDSQVGEFTRLEYADMLSTGQMNSVLRRDMLIAITVNYKDCYQEIRDHGGDVEGMSAVLVNRVMRVLDMLKDCGVRTEEVEWLSGDKLRGAVRLAFDPLSSDWLIANNLEHPADQPMMHIFDEYRDYLLTNNGAHHCSYWIERWPSIPMSAGVMTKLIGGGTVPHTVTQIWEGTNLQESEKKITNQMLSKESARKLNEKFLGRPESTDAKVEDSDIALRHAEMTLGYGDVRYSGFITVHASSLKELNQSDMWVKEASAGMNVNKALARQGATFITACLPLGLGSGVQ